MIHHIVLWRLKPEASGAHRREFIERIERCLEALRLAMPGIVRLELGQNQATGPDASDLMLNSEFEDWEALRRYDAHPLHDELKAIIGPARSERRVIDYER
jgi:quinol monooxygenase YgiN